MTTCTRFWRGRLRADFVSRLTSTTAASTRVFPGRALPFSIYDPSEAAAQLPALTVYAEGGSFESGRGGDYAGEADVVVEAYVTGADEPAADTALDALLDQIYSAIIDHDFERCTIDSFRDEPVVGEDGGVFFGVSRLTFSVSFGLCRSAPVDLNPFETAHIAVDQYPADGIPDIEVIATPVQPPAPPAPEEPTP